MSKPTEIIPGVGLGELIFGSTFQETRAILGDPDDIGRSEEEDEETGEISISEMWTYGSLGVTAHFDEDDDFKLGMLSVNAPKYKLEGLSLFGKKEADVLKLLKPLDYGKIDEEDVIFEDDDEAPEGRLISFFDKEIEFWFADNKLNEIQWSPFWADDENRIWPTK